MELEIIAIYCWCELILNQLNIKDDWRSEMSNAEVLTASFLSCKFHSNLDKQQGAGGGLNSLNIILIHVRMKFTG